MLFRSQYVRREARGTTALWEGRWLERSFPTDLPAHCTAWLWITVHVPEGTRAGLYRGAVVISADGGLVEIPVRVRVLDFTLQRPPGSWGLYLPGHFAGSDDGVYHNYAEGEEWRAENLERYFRFWKTRGLNSPTLFHIYTDLKCVDGHAVAGFPQVRAFAEAMKAAGLDGDLCLDVRFMAWWANTAAAKLAELRAQGESTAGDIGVYGPQGSAVPDPSEEAKRLFGEVMTQLLDVAEGEEWPHVLLAPEEEVANAGLKNRTYDAFMPVIQSLAPERALLIDNSIGYGRKDALDRGERDAIAFRQYNNWTQEGLDAAARQGQPVRSYNYGWRRSAWGLYQHRIQSTGFHQWADQWKGEPGWQYAKIRSDGIVSSPNMERARAGRDDHAYLHTLESLVARLDDAGRSAEADRGRQVLEGVTSDLPVNRLKLVDWQRDNRWPQLETRRWQLAVAIQDARRSLGYKVARSGGVAPGKPGCLGIASRKSGPRPATKTLYAPRVSEPIALDAEFDEAAWGSAENSTGALWWTWQREATMRAQVGSDEEFDKMYLPSHGHAQFAYGDEGLYIAIACNHATEESAWCEFGDDDPGIWQDDCMEFFFQTDPEREAFHQLIVNVCGKRALMRFPDLVPDPGIITATTSPTNDSGGYRQEVFVPWRAFGLAGPPEPSTGWPTNVGREFNSWGQITCWGQVNSQFAEKQHWGMLVFQGGQGTVVFRDLSLGARYPGRNRATGSIALATGGTVDGVGVRVVDGAARVVAEGAITETAGEMASFAVDYAVPTSARGSEWRLQVTGAGGEVLGTVPLLLFPVDRAITIESFPATVVAGSVVPMDLSVKIGDLTAPERDISLSLRRDGGRALRLPATRLADGAEQRLWLDTSGLAPGNYELSISLLGAPTDQADAVQIDVLPSPVSSSARPR